MLTTPTKRGRPKATPRGAPRRALSPEARACPELLPGGKGGQHWELPSKTWMAGPHLGEGRGVRGDRDGLKKRDKKQE